MRSWRESHLSEIRQYQQPQTPVSQGRHYGLEVSLRKIDVQFKLKYKYYLYSCNLEALIYVLFPHSHLLAPKKALLHYVYTVISALFMQHIIRGTNIDDKTG